MKQLYSPNFVGNCGTHFDEFRQRRSRLFGAKTKERPMSFAHRDRCFLANFLSLCNCWRKVWLEPVWQSWAIFEKSWRNIFCKSSQNGLLLFGLKWKHHSLAKTAVVPFWATFVKTWATFYFNIWSHWTTYLPTYLPTYILIFNLSLVLFFLFCRPSPSKDFKLR